MIKKELTRLPETEQSKIGAHIYYFDNTIQEIKTNKVKSFKSDAHASKKSFVKIFYKNPSLIIPKAFFDHDYE